jgi:hypothetical protein
VIGPQTVTTKRIAIDSASVVSKTDTSVAETPPVPSVPVAAPEESLVADTRAGLRPAQMVERKLITLLKSHAVPMSHVQVVATGMKRTC